MESEPDVKYHALGWKMSRPVCVIFVLVVFVIFGATVSSVAVDGVNHDLLKDIDARVAKISSQLGPETLSTSSNVAELGTMPLNNCMNTCVNLTSAWMSTYTISPVCVDTCLCCMRLAACDEYDISESDCLVGNDKCASTEVMAAYPTKCDEFAF
jgi:hypothetical protein